MHEIKGCWVNGRYMSWCNCGTILCYNPHSKEMVITLCTNQPRHTDIRLTYLYVPLADVPLRVRMYAHIQEGVLARRPQHIMDARAANLPAPEQQLDVSALVVWATFINTSFSCHEI